MLPPAAWSHPLRAPHKSLILSHKMWLLQVVLPEGASDPKVALDLPFQLEQATTYTYLDVLGR